MQFQRPEPLCPAAEYYFHVIDLPNRFSVVSPPAFLALSLKTQVLSFAHDRFSTLPAEEKGLWLAPISTALVGEGTGL